MKRLVPLIACFTMIAPTTAHAWSPLRAENPDVKKGNALMDEGQPVEALDAYDQAARALPDARGVQLNRGLAFLAQDLSEPAEEALSAAADPSAPPGVRAAAYYNLGIVHARRGGAASEEQSFEQSTAHFREAAEAFKRSLRIRPGDRNAAWNLEYALERIREEEQKQEQQQQQQDQQDQEQQQQDQPDQEQQDEGQEQQPQEADGEPEEPPSEPEGEEEPPQDEGSEPQEQQADESRGEAPPEPMERSEVDRFLDALEQNEESLPVQRARQRSGGRRPPEKDW
jgi:Ca-activated chloride channel family protein